MTAPRPRPAPALQARSWARRAAAALAAGSLVAGALAHTTSTGLATLDARSDAPAWRLGLAPAELGNEAGATLARATSGDAAAAQQVAAWLQADLALAVDDAPCRIRRTRLQGSQLGDERVVLLLDFACPAAPRGRIVLRDALDAHFGEHYRSITSVLRADGSREERIFDREHREAAFEAVPAAAVGEPRASGWLDFIRLGLGHILSGADHLLFLAALLIGVRRVRTLLVTVTAFTLAHSASLALAVLGWVEVAPAIVEPAIAASIVWVALENLFRRGSAAGAGATWRRHGLTFAFGLVHGLGFAEALRELQLHGAALARALLGFNLGVEAGQALVVLALAPLLAWAARRPAAARWERVASTAIALAGAGWLVQRLAA